MVLSARGGGKVCYEVVFSQDGTITVEPVSCHREGILT
jgi:hypothetical protein